MEPELIDDAADLDAIFRLRFEVWKAIAPEASTWFPDGRWSDDHDHHARHYVIRAGGQIDASARMCVHDSVAALPGAHLFGHSPDLAGPLAALNRLVVRPKARRQGYAKKLIQARLTDAATLGCRAALIHVWQVSGEGHLEYLLREGFKPLAPTLLEEPPFGTCVALVYSLG